MSEITDSLGQSKPSWTEWSKYSNKCQFFYGLSSIVWYEIYTLSNGRMFCEAGITLITWDEIVERFVGK